MSFSSSLVSEFELSGLYYVLKVASSQKANQTISSPPHCPFDAAGRNLQVVCFVGCHSGTATDASDADGGCDGLASHSIQTFLLLKRPTCLPCSPGWEPEKGCEKLFQCSPTTFSPSRIAISTATAVREFGRERENGEKSTISSGKRRPLQLTIGYQ